MMSFSFFARLTAPAIFLLVLFLMAIGATHANALDTPPMKMPYSGCTAYQDAACTVRLPDDNGNPMHAGRVKLHAPYAKCEKGWHINVKCSQDVKDIKCASMKTNPAEEKCCPKLDMTEDVCIEHV